MEAQLSNINDMLAEDVNQDGKMDLVFLSLIIPESVTLVCAVEIEIHISSNLTVKTIFFCISK